MREVEYPSEHEAGRSRYIYILSYIGVYVYKYRDK